LIDQPSHLTNDAADFLRDSDCNRIYFIQSKRWIAYTRAKQIFAFMNRLLVHPRTTRMPSLAVYGDSGMGKSILIEKFRDDHGIAFDAKQALAKLGFSS
jgi:Bacterial TniB protein